MDTAGEVESAAVTAMLSAAGTRPFVYVSGIGVVGQTGDQPVSETDRVRPPPGMSWRRELEQNTLAAPHGIVLRPGLVYGHAGGLVLTGLIRGAIQTGEARYAAPGDNSWPNVHLDDVSALGAKALEHAPAAGTVLHAVGGHSTPRHVAGAIARLIGRPDRAEAFPEHRIDEVPFGAWLRSNQCIDATMTRQLLDWSPTGPDIEEDLTHGSYRSLLP